METTTLIQLSPDDLQRIVSDAVARQLSAWQPPTPQAPSTPDTDEYLSRYETRDYLRCSLSALQQWEHNGRLVPVRIGRKVLYRRADVEKALTGRQS